ncbi:MAG: hypothetical protein ACMUJM_08410 [bacterium]
MIFSNAIYIKLIGSILCVSLFFILFINKKGYCADLNVGIEFNSEKTETKDTEGNVDDTSEYRPKLFMQYKNQIAQTELLGNLKIDYRKEKNMITRERMEPSFDFGLRSDIYQLNAGLNETRERQNELDPVVINKYRFGEGIVQPQNFPVDFRFKLSQRENEDIDKTDRQEVEVRYNMFPSLEFVGNYYEVEYDDPQNNEQRIIGRVRGRHTFFPKKILKVEAGYKVESLYRENQRDEIIHTIQGKASYKPLQKTLMNIKYETEILDNQKDPNRNNNDYKIDFDLSQKLWEWMHIKYQRSWDKEEADILNGDTSEKNIWLLETTIDPTRWLDLNFKWISEDESFDPNNNSRGRYLTEQSWRAYFENFFKSRQTVNHRTISESLYSKEEYIKWSWATEPIKNLNLEPAYEFSTIKKYDTLNEDTTREYSLEAGYTVTLLDKTEIEISHSWDEKKIKTDYNDPNTGISVDHESKEYNTASKLDISAQPFENLYLNTGLNIEKRDDRINFLHTKDTTYFIKFDFDLNAWNLSGSYQYDKREVGIDTESVESKIGYAYNNYSIEVKYKYNYTFSEPSEYEDTLFFKFKTKF